MSDHTEACIDSRNLCDHLFTRLSQKVPNLQKVETKRWCAFFQENKNRFAYINHRKGMHRIEVWCLGEPTILQDKTTLKIEPRTSTTGGFAKLFQSRFFVDNISSIEDACKLLYQISLNYYEME